MTMAAVDVCNLALQRLGQSKITTLADGTDTANLCNDSYVGHWKAVMRDAEWRCLERFAVLTSAPGTLTLSAKTIGTGRTATSSVAFFRPEDVGGFLY